MEPPHSRRGPRVERTAIASGGSATVTWLSPRDEDLQGFAVQMSSDGTTWKTVAHADASATSARFALSGGARVRLLPIMKGVDDALARTSIAWMPRGAERARDRRLRSPRRWRVRRSLARLLGDRRRGDRPRRDDRAPRSRRGRLRSERVRRDRLAPRRRVGRRSATSAAEQAIATSATSLAAATCS